MSYPKPLSSQSKVFAISRSDTSATAKCVLPKDAVILGVYVMQTAAAVTGAATIDVGFSGGTGAELLNDFSMATTSVGYSAGGAATGSALGTKLTADKTVTLTYTVGTSSAGGTGYVKIEYAVPGPGETL